MEAYSFSIISVRKTVNYCIFPPRQLLLLLPFHLSDPVKTLLSLNVLTLFCFSLILWPLPSYLLIISKDVVCGIKYYWASNKICPMSMFKSCHFNCSSVCGTWWAEGATGVSLCEIHLFFRNSLLLPSSLCLHKAPVSFPSWFPHAYLSHLLTHDLICLQVSVVPKLTYAFSNQK